MGWEQEVCLGFGGLQPAWIPGRFPDPHVSLGLLLRHRVPETARSHEEINSHGESRLSSHREVRTKLNGAR